MKAKKSLPKELSRSSKITPIKQSWKGYRDLEQIPILTWFKINETHDYTKLIKKGKATIDELAVAWFNIMDEYVKYVGISDNYKELLETKQKLYIAMIDYELTGDRNHLNFINIYKKILDDSSETKGESNYYKTIRYVETYLGYGINETKYSARKFFETLKEAKDHYEQLNLKAAKNGK
jgi:hypothetical protein